MSVLDTLCVELTARCPLRCVHCSANAAPERPEILPWDLLAAQLTELGFLGELYLSGGEPFEHPDFLRIVKVGAGVSPMVVAYSSGTRLMHEQVGPLPMQLLTEARRAGLGRVDLSLYSADAAAHEAITQQNGSLSATIQTARRVRRVGLDLGIHFVPIGLASEDIARVAELARVLGASRFHVLGLTRQGRAGSGTADLAPTPHFWRLLQQVWQGSKRDVILSSALRSAIGHHEPTPRDRLRSAFLDVRGFLYPGEGQRMPRLRSRSSIRSGTSIAALAQEVWGDPRPTNAAG